MWCGSFKLYNILKATPHKYCASDAQSDSSSDCIKISQACCRLSRNFCVIWWKICKQMMCKAARRALCGVAFNNPLLLRWVLSNYVIYYTYCENLCKYLILSNGNMIYIILWLSYDIYVFWFIMWKKCETFNFVFSYYLKYDIM